MKEIIIHGTPRPIHFGLRAIHEFTQERGADFASTVSSAEALSTLDSIVALTATGLNEGAPPRDSMKEPDVRATTGATPKTKYGTSSTKIRRLF